MKDPETELVNFLNKIIDENIENFKSKLINVFSEYITFDESDQLIPELFKISLRYGSGFKEQLGDKTNFSKHSVELYKKFNVMNDRIK